jgi:hypothetical protein
MKENLYMKIVEKTDGNHFKVTYFKKEVLNKYYNEPDIYRLMDSMLNRSSFLSKIDNNVDDYIPYFLQI